MEYTHFILPSQPPGLDLGVNIFLLDLILAGRPLVLQLLIERQTINILRPPLTPARQEEPLGVLGDIILKERSHEARATYKWSVRYLLVCDKNGICFLSYLRRQIWHRACSGQSSCRCVSQAQSGGLDPARQQRFGRCLEVDAATTECPAAG